MKIEYRRTKTTVSMINYHFVFCPRYRRKLFLIDGFEARFKELTTQICEQNDIVILAMECHIDHCHLFVNAPPTLSAADIMKIIKGNTISERMAHLSSGEVVQRDLYSAFLLEHIDTETLKYDIEALKATFPAFLKMHENTKKRLQEAESYLPASVGF